MIECMAERQLRQIEKSIQRDKNGMNNRNIRIQSFTYELLKIINTNNLRLFIS